MTDQELLRSDLIHILKIFQCSATIVGSKELQEHFYCSSIFSITVVFRKNKTEKEAEEASLL